MFSKACSWFTSIYFKRISINNKSFSKFSSNELLIKKKTKTTFNYMVAIGILTIGFTYASVPLYRIFCQEFSYGGTISHKESNISEMKQKKNRILNVKFNADTAAQMSWQFQPQQNEVKVMPGETALAFYTATNPTDVPIVGISTYNIVPFEAGQYFNKIQCFCFEEQFLAPHENVDMPVFFFIDPEFTEDPKMEHVNELVLSYTFFEAKEGIKLPIPSYIKKIQ
ncbi:PREDICTED: LOW QUALITY PROTEIN: cytochrome c oxidase assembly protein ctaG [Ceratosolen solmsi marchali]|uniref:Cytochrome c oxidase assembly protein COX11, mitochondrial n=1 Tax=Ceratosolen solmsi marchali TaxID=326594 RepID=A0AAJ7DUM1_9HYME|nr:PREDICTED: LOW QUALITY PROTEIN: cytochrome c oxidase assembly protein ctaG [Ceratosolen solmsi marchali]